MSNNRQTSSSATQTSLPANQQTNVDALLSGALDYFNSGGRSFFPGDTVADFDPYQIQGQNALVNYGTGIGRDLVSGAIEGNRFFSNPENILNPDNIPGFKGTIDDITRGYTENLTRNILPSIRGGGTASGQFGGSASGIGQGLAVGESNKALGDSISNLYLGAYGQGLSSFNQALDRAPSLFQLGTAPGALIAGVGGQRQAQAQREIGGERERFSFGENEQSILLSLLQQFTGSAGQYGGTTSTTGTQSFSGGSGALQGVGGALTLASLLGGLGGGGGSKGGGTGE